MIDENLPGDNGLNEDATVNAVIATDGIVVSSRIRLVRNIAEFPFVNACSNDQRSQIESTVKAGLRAHRGLSELTLLDADQLELLERQFLLDLQIVAGVNLGATTELMAADNSLDSCSTTADIVLETTIPEQMKDDDSIGNSSVILNEEDHLRIQVSRAGFDLENAWRHANRLDDLIEQQISYAFNPRWGYLTACPANVGTGMRASVVMHLPALVLTDQISEVLRGLSRASISAREFWGDETGSEFFRIGNQTTLGLSEMDLIRQLADVVPAIVETERKARSELVGENREMLRADASAAAIALLHANLNDHSEASRTRTIRLLSKVRFGSGMGLLEKSETRPIIVKIQLWKLRQQLEDAVRQEDYHRASSLRDRIQFLEGGSP